MGQLSSQDVVAWLGVPLTHKNQGLNLSAVIGRLRANFATLRWLGGQSHLPIYKNSDLGSTSKSPNRPNRAKLGSGSENMRHPSDPTRQKGPRATTRSRPATKKNWTRVKERLGHHPKLTKEPHQDAANHIKPYCVGRIFF